MKTVVKIVLMLVMAVGVVLPAQEARADVTPFCDNDEIDWDVRQAAGCEDRTTTAPGVIKTVLDVVLSAVGVVAVGVMVYGGYVYATSAGDPAKTTKGKRVLIYGLVGMLVALLAYAIVQFVVKNVPA